MNKRAHPPADLVWTTTPALVAGLPLARAFPSGRGVTVLLLSALLPSVLAAVLAGRPPRRVATMAALFPPVGMLLLACGPVTLLDALWNGWARWLSTTPPLPVSATYLAVVFALVWPVSWVANELALRTSTPLLPALPGLILLLVSLVFSPGGSDLLHVTTAVAFLLASGVMALIRSAAAVASTPQSTQPNSVPVVATLGRERRGLQRACGLAAIAVVGVTMGQLLPERDRFDLRELRQAAFLPESQSNPLVEVSQYADGPERPLFELRTRVRDGPTDVPVYLRVAVLDRYDGQRWSARPQFEPVGSELPRDRGNDDPDRSATVVQDLRFDGLESSWIPAADRPVSADVGSARGLLFDGDTGLLALDTARLAGAEQVQVVSSVPVPDVERLVDAGVAQGTSPSFLQLPPDLPPAFGQLADGAAGPGDRPAFRRLADLQEFFRGEFTFDSTAPGGHALAQLEAFLDQRGRIGNAEQFGAAFALLARTLGYPARVVVGFKPVTGSTDTVVRGSDVYVWAEVALEGFGWVPFEPVPLVTADGKVAEPVASSAAAMAEQAASEIPRPTGGPDTTTPPGEGPTAAQRSSASSGWRWVALVALGALLMAAGPTTIVVAKTRRRQARRRAKTPAAAVVGAWLEAGDRLVERGLALSPAQTTTEVSAASTRLNAALALPVQRLGHLVNRVLYDPTGTPTSDESAAAWRCVAEAETVLGRQESYLRHLRAMLNTRPLLEGSRKRGARRSSSTASA